MGDVLSFPIEMAKTSETTITKKGVSLCKPYTFKVRALNECGEGEFSESVSVFASTRPKQMEKVTANSTGCQITFNWNKTDDCGSDVTSYKIEVKAKNSSFYPIPATKCPVVGEELSCSADLSDFTEKPWGLDNMDSDHEIIARVVAVNTHGDSDPSEEFATGVIVMRRPQQMLPPRIDAAAFTLDSMLLKWDEITVDNKMGGTIITSYRLAWDQGLGKNMSVMMNELVTEKNVTGLQPGQKYRFKIQAENVCGASPYSEEVSQALPSVPSIPVTTAR